MVYLFVMRLYVYVKFAQDPFFDKLEAETFNKAYQILSSVGLCLVTAYTLYFGMIVYRAASIIKFLKKSFRFSIGTTLFVMALSSYLMIKNG